MAQQLVETKTPPQRVRRPERITLGCVSWPEYTRFIRAFAGQRGCRLTYVRGVLEIMSPSVQHEWPSSLVGRFVETLTEELRLPVIAGGSTTLKRKKKMRGVEPDE